MSDDFGERGKPTHSLGGGYKPLHDIECVKKPAGRVETTRERAVRQRRKRQEELRYTKEDEARWARNRERALSEGQADETFNIKVALQTKDGIELPSLIRNLKPFLKMALNKYLKLTIKVFQLSLQRWQGYRKSLFH